MHFANPMALWGLLSIPAILVMYLLKQKYKELPVPSLFLWTAAIARSDAARPFQKLRRNSLMFLQLLAAMLLTLALAKPFIKTHDRAAELILVLDCSLSMQATDATPSRFERAQAEAKRLVERLGPQGKAAIVVLSAEPYVASGFSTNKSMLISRIQSLAPTNRAGDFDAAATLATALAEQGSPEIILLTDSDAPFPIADYAARRFLVGNTADNTSITRVSPRLEDELLVCLVQMKHYGDAAATNTVALYADDKLVDLVEINLAPNEDRDVYFTNLPPTAQVLVARLTESDALAADNTAWHCIQPELARRTMLFAERNVFLENMLAILPNIELYKGNTDIIDNISDYYLYVYDCILPQSLPEDGHILIFNPPTGNAILETGEIIDVSSETLTLRGSEKLLDNTDFAVQSAKRIAVPDWAEVALSAGDVPLVLSGQLEGRRIVVFAFDLHDTDLPLCKEFPIFMYNLCNQFMPSAALSAQALTVGSPIELQPEPNARSMYVTLPNGTQVTLAPPFPAAPLTQTDSPGVYTVTQSCADATVQTHFAIHLAPDEDADLRRATPEGYIDENLISSSNESAEITSAAGSIDLTIYVLAALLLCLMAEWWLHNRNLS